MPRNARTVAAGLPYHITQRGTNCEKVFFSVADRHLYLRLIRENLSDAGVKVLAYCLMSNHVHFVVVPDREDSLAVLFARANGRYARRWPTPARDVVDTSGRPVSSHAPSRNSACEACWDTWRPTHAALGWGAARGVPLVKRRGTPDRGGGSQWYPRPSVLPAGGRNGEVAAGARESSQRRGPHETAPLHVLGAALWRRVVPFGVGGSIPSPLAPIQTGGGIGVFRGNRPDQCAEIGILNSSTQAYRGTSRRSGPGL